MKQKLYCYVDETGQDTKGKLFLVPVVITNSQKEKLRDKLNKIERHRFSAGLRQLKVSVRKVRGLRDQSDEFIRLADSIAGFTRDVLEEDQLMKSLYKKAKENKIIQKHK